MRPLGLCLAALLAAPVVWAQTPPAPPVPPATPGGVPVTPVQPAAQPPAAQPPVGQPAAANPRLDAHLGEWSKQMSGLTNFRSDFDLVEKDTAFKRDRKYTGSILVMKPNLARMRQDSADSKDDYKAYICNGQALYEYLGLQKTITEFKLNPNPNGGDNLMLDLVKGMSADVARQRFDISLFKEDANYVYLDIKPRFGKDMQEFTQVRFALYGPGVKPPFTPYLPAQALLVKPNGDQEVWTFKNPQTNLQGITPAVFQPVKIDGWQVKQGNAAAPPPMGPPGGLARPAPMPPGGGALPPKP